MPKIFIIWGVLCILSFMASQAETAQRYDSPKIVINIPSRTLSFYSEDQLVKQYPVGIGRMNHQTPIGTFKIFYKELNPLWIAPGGAGEAPFVIPSGPDNPLGYRWMEFADLYGIHGTNDPNSIGGYVSNGCVRMYESDVEELYAMVPLATPVTVTYDRLIVQLDEHQSVTLFIYPDEYQRASLSLQDVKHKLAEYNAADLVSDERLSEKLEKANGKPIAIGRPSPR